MKRLMFFIFLISIFSFSAKAQYRLPYPQTITTQVQDLGPYGYGSLQQEIMQCGRILGPGRYQQRLRSSMFLLGRSMPVDKVRNLQMGPAGSVVWEDLYLNGISIGRTNVVGRTATTTLYNQNIQRAMYPQRRIW
ncbi:hypothetical protein SDC9_07757 [bioreactor metagenome]|uniref:Uncharacterized protein n=1 Tax=bioreactor metagenome TaxID=1076179 RepID=A0A644T5R9_9ZZZZ|nr:hypothetical protein [Candidatus Elulimicrobiales bacterium]